LGSAGGRESEGEGGAPHPSCRLRGVHVEPRPHPRILIPPFRLVPRRFVRSRFAHRAWLIANGGKNFMVGRTSAPLSLRAVDTGRRRDRHGADARCPLPRKLKRPKTAPRAANISATLLEFARPLLDLQDLVGSLTAAEMSLAATIWNAVPSTGGAAAPRPPTRSPRSSSRCPSRSDRPREACFTIASRSLAACLGRSARSPSRMTAGAASA
jgi:hypothetical protein